MKKVIILLILTHLIITAHAQNNKFSILLGGGETINGRTFHFPYIDETNQGGVWVRKEKVPYFQIGLGYYFTKSIETGIYIGYSGLMLPSKPNDIYDSSSGAGSGFFYGFQFKYHFLNALSSNPTRIDIYGIAQTGALTKHWNKYYNVQNESIFEGGAGLGGAFYFTKHIGIFGEALGGKFYYSNFNWRAGLSIRI